MGEEIFSTRCHMPTNREVNSRICQKADTTAFWQMDGSRTKNNWQECTHLNVHIAVKFGEHRPWKTTAHVQTITVL